MLTTPQSNFERELQPFHQIREHAVPQESFPPVQRDAPPHLVERALLPDEHAKFGRTGYGRVDPLAVCNYSALLVAHDDYTRRFAPLHAVTGNRVGQIEVATPATFTVLVVTAPVPVP